MFLKQLILQNFRNYKKAEFNFKSSTTLIIGANTSGKSNLLESVIFLASGKSSKAEKDIDAIRFSEEMARISGEVRGQSSEVSLEVVLTKGLVANIETPLKQFRINKIPKRRVDFAGNLSAVSFDPSDLELIIGSPSMRRTFLDDTLEATDGKYRKSLADYIKALRQRNALLDLVQKTGRRPEKQFEYWDNALIENGNYITLKREEFIKFVNASKKDIFDCVIFYDHSTISRERLDQYKSAEEGAGVTLVGPHRDDFYLEYFNKEDETAHNVKSFGSRGQQRLVVLQLKITQMDYIEKERGERPIFLLDDIFSELDEGHIGVVLSQIDKQQTMITTAHEELVPQKLLEKMEVIRLNQ